MYLFLGKKTVIDDRTLVGIFDLDATTVSKTTRDYLSMAQKRDEIFNVSYELPKSFVICEDYTGKQKVYISQSLPSTIIKRTKYD